jgi:hypothetical protein
MRYRRYYPKAKPDGSIRVISTGPYWSFLVLVGTVLCPLFAVAMLWEFWLAMFAWHFGSGGIFLLIYAFIVGMVATAIPRGVAFNVYRIITLGAIAVAPLLILAGGLVR